MINIYKLEFSSDPRIYIGLSTRDPEDRLKEHIYRLNSGTHHSYKLQKAWPECGQPTLSILECCNNDIGNAKEIEYIRNLNSYTEGFNVSCGGTFGGGGYLSPSAKYTEDDYRCVLAFLAYTDWTLEDISNELDVSISVVSSISSCTSHTLLKESMPEQYTLMLNRKRYGKSNIHNNFPNIVSPEGISHSVQCARRFAAEHSLNPSSVQKVLTGLSNSHRGWKLETTLDSNFTASRGKIRKDWPKISSPESIIYTVTNANVFAKEHGLDYSGLHRLLSNKANSHKGWRLANVSN